MAKWLCCYGSISDEEAEDFPPYRPHLNLSRNSKSTKFYQQTSFPSVLQQMQAPSFSSQQLKCFNSCNSSITGSVDVLILNLQFRDPLILSCFVESLKSQPVQFLINAEFSMFFMLKMHLWQLNILT